MKIKFAPVLGLFLACLLISGCTGGDLDFCSLLSVDELRKFDANVVSSKMGERGGATPTMYCIYKNSNDEEVFLLSIGNATKNPPYEILKTYSAHMDGENTVEKVDGIGIEAAALFSDDYETDKFRILFANSDKWSVTIRALGISEKNSKKFAVLTALGNTALARF